MTLEVRLDDGLAELARRILSGEIAIVAHVERLPMDKWDSVLDLESLEGLARLCELKHLYAEAARIRRWVAT